MYTLNTLPKNKQSNWRKSAQNKLRYALLASFAVGSLLLSSCHSKKITADKPHQVTELTRQTFWDGWIKKCFPEKDWSKTTFTTYGLTAEKVKKDAPEIYQSMSDLYANEQLAERFLPELIAAGSTIPVKKTVDQGKILYKFIPKGGNINSPSPYFLSEETYRLAKKEVNLIEQKLELPLSSVAGSYAIFTITAKQTQDVYQSKVAPSVQFAKATPNVRYKAPGGYTQTLIINNTNPLKWQKSSSAIEIITPNVLPLVKK